MKTFKIFLVACLLLASAYADLMSEMEALEKELEARELADQKEDSSSEKALKDMSTEELMDELKKEVGKAKKSAVETHREKFDDLTKRLALEEEVEQELKLADAAAKAQASDDESDKDFDNLIKNVIEDEIKKNSNVPAYAKGTNDATEEDTAKFDELKERVKKDYYGDELVPFDKCKDQMPNCNIYKKYCEVYKKNLIKRCPKTCNFCAKPVTTPAPAVAVTACKDKLPKRTCKMAKKMCDSENSVQRTRVQKLCAETCMVCRAPSPPRCENTEYGCCWDKETIKTDKKGSSCPACQDEFKYICKTFKDDCVRVTHNSGLFMYRNCKTTCGVCNNNYCEDDPRFAKSCHFWKKYLKQCEKDTAMKGLCKKTCGHC